MRRPPQPPSPARFNRRLLIAMAGSLAGFGLLAAQAWNLQVASYDKYHALAEDNRITMLPLAPQRGRILDRNGIVLAEDVYTPALEIATSQARNVDRLVQQLSKIVPISPLEVRRFKRLAAGNKNTDGTIPLKTRLTDEEAARLAAVRFRFDGLEIKARPHRHYPLGTTAAHVIGHIGRISNADNDMLARTERTSDYAGSTHIGKLGLEQSYETQLHGKVGLADGPCARCRGSRPHPARTSGWRWTFRCSSWPKSCWPAIGVRWWPSSHVPVKFWPSCRCPASTPICLSMASITATGRP